MGEENTSIEMKMWFLSLDKETVEIHKVYAMESPVISDIYLFDQNDGRKLTMEIKTSVLSIVLEDFCKKRANIRMLYAHDEHRLQSMLKDFDSQFYERHHANAIAFFDAACKLEIKSLYDLMLKDTFDIITQKMTTKEIEELFNIRYVPADHDDDDEFEDMSELINSAFWRF